MLVVGDKGSVFFLINRKDQPVCVRGRVWYSAKYDCVSINTLKNKRTVEPRCNVIIVKCSQTALALIRVHTLKMYTAQSMRRKGDGETSRKGESLQRLITLLSMHVL